MALDRPIRLAMVGGGAGSFIGPVHRMAAELDRAFTLVAGAFSSDAARSIEAGAAWGLGEACGRLVGDAAERAVGERLGLLAQHAHEARMAMAE